MNQTGHCVTFIFMLLPEEFCPGYIVTLFSKDDKFHFQIAVCVVLGVGQVQLVPDMHNMSRASCQPRSRFQVIHRAALLVFFFSQLTCGPNKDAQIKLLQLHVYLIIWLCVHEWKQDKN